MPAAAAPLTLPPAAAAAEPGTAAARALAASIAVAPGGGSVLVPLSAVSTDGAVACFTAIQGPRLGGMGIAGDGLRRYGEYFVRNGRECPCSVALVNISTGEVGGLLVYFNHSYGAEDLPAAPAAHRRLAVALADEVHKMTPGEERGIESVFGGLLDDPTYRGRNLILWMQRESAAIAARVGVKRYWSWTMNPTMIKAQGKAGWAMWLTSRAAAAALATLPAWAINAAVLRPMAAVGAIPAGTDVVIVPCARFPFLAAYKPPHDILAAQFVFRSIAPAGAARRRGAAVDAAAAASRATPRL